MTIPVSPVTNTQSFGVWLSRSNQVFKIISNNAVTVDASGTGSISTGNGVVNGYFGANTLTVFNAIRGGDLTDSNNLFVTSNVAFQNTTANVVAINSNTTNNSLLLTLGGNGYVFATTNNANVNVTTYFDINSPVTNISGNTEVSNLKTGSVSYTTTSTFTTSTTGAETADSFAAATFRGAEYLVTIKVGTTYQLSKLLVLHDGTNSYVTEYGTIRSSATNLATFASSISGSNVLLTVQSSSAGAVINIHRVTIYA